MFTWLGVGLVQAWVGQVVACRLLVMSWSGLVGIGRGFIFVGRDRLELLGAMV